MSDTHFSAEPLTLRDGRAVTLRPPVLDDAAAMIAYLDSVRRTAPYILVSPDDELPSLDAEHNFIRSHLRDDALMLLAIDAAGQIVAIAGVAGGGRVKKRHVAGLGISIAQPFRGVGLGRILMDRLITFCRADPTIHKVSLSVYADNTPAIHLYESCGFHAEGRRVRHIRQPDGTFVDELMMGLWVG